MAIIGDVKCFVQANNGHILAGTSDAARIYRSTDNGQTWTQVLSIGSSGSVNALAKDSVGNLYAAVTGNAATQGVWKSVDHGASWNRVKSHPNNVGYNDITSIQNTGRLVAVASGITDVNTSSPVIYSADSGVTWSNVYVTHYSHPHIAVAAYPEPVLFTQYPGELYGSVFTFYGTDTYYTSLGGVGVSGGVPQNYGFGTTGGGAGNGGLDMAVFLLNDGTNNYRRRALWAVKSHLNVADTEIWQWPVSPTGSYQFAKIATITGEIFNVLYVDPSPTYTSTQRTIWAGANGRIWVSYNSGLAWAVATELPIGNIYALIRTTSGELIAGGASGEIFLFSGGSGGEGGGGDPEDESTVGVTSSQFLGREATCEDEVYASNKTSFTNITHVLAYNGATYEELQFATVLPYYLFGSTPAAGGAIYFGSKTTDSNVPSGTFSSLVFDITQAAEDITLIWEYWSGAAWNPITVQDNTSNFSIAGVHSVHWSLSSMSWMTTTVNGVTGYWVRSRITAVGGDVVAPVHDNRYIYTINLPYVEIAEDEINGDLPALMKIKWNNRADDLSTNLSLQLDRLICGLRSVSRGENFNSYLNISDVQTPFGITLSKDADGVWAASTQLPTTRYLTVSHASGARLNTWNNLVTFTFANTVARDYYGQYRAFLRVYKFGSGTNNWQLRLRTVFGSGGGSVVTKAVFPTLAAYYEVLDLGQISIPTIHIAHHAGNIGDQMSLAVQGYNTATGIGLALFDLILIPFDEWAIDARAPELSTTATTDVRGSYYMDMDSISNPKMVLSALNRNSADQIVSRYQAINNGPAILQKNSTQRLWFLGMSYEDFWRGFPEIAGSVQVFKQQRYLGFRGRN